MQQIPAAFKRDADALPPLLRELLEAELAVGNTISGVRYTFPAPPIGACIMLASKVTTRERSSGDGFVFRESNGADYSGQFTDEKGYFHILEPPDPEPAYPDMDAIRAAHNTSRPSAPEIDYSTPAVSGSGSVLVDQFRESMRMDFDKWHDGIGYNIELLTTASPSERLMIEPFLIPPSDWRDVEALAALDTGAAASALRTALHSSNAEVRNAVLRYAPAVPTGNEKTSLLVQALQHAEFYGGLTAALDQVAEFHPRRVVNALVRGLFVRPGEIATHFAAMLWFIHGKSDDIFDWDRRPLFLKFNSQDGAERRAAFLELCTLLELDSHEVLAQAGTHNDDA